MVVYTAKVIGSTLSVPGRVEKSSDSLFHYTAGTDFSTYQKDNSYEPTFTADALAGLNDEERAAVEAVCGTNKQCTFDLVVTGNSKCWSSYVALTRKMLGNNEK